MIPQLYKDGLKALLAIVILTILNFNLPMLSLFIYIIWPIPIIYMILKHGLKNTVILIIAASLINGLMLGAIMGLYTVVGFGLIGFILGTSLEEDFSPGKSLVLTIGGVLISNVIIAAISSYVLGVSYSQLLNEIVQSISQSPEFSQLSGILEQQIILIERIFPAITVITSIIIGSLTYYSALWYLNRKGMNLSVYKPVRLWRFPHWWVSLGIVVSLLFKNNLIFANLNIILLFLASLQGFAVGLYYLNKRNLPSVFTFVFIVIIILFNVLSFLVLALIGLVDMWFNLRKFNSAEG